MKISMIHRTTLCGAVLAMTMATGMVPEAHAGAGTHARAASPAKAQSQGARHGGGAREFDAGTPMKIAGATYGEWGARWVAWAEAGPVGQNVLTDDSGQYCAANQPRADVWFLGGTLGGAAQRSCTIPAGRALFYPVVTVTWVDCPGTPDEALSDLDVREILVAVQSEPVELSSTLNGTSILSLRASIVRAQSPVFRNVLPANNLLDDTGTCATPLGAGRTGRRIADGYWVMLPPLPAGRHTLTFRGAFPSFESSVTYHLHVTAR